jgi:NCAIR mutase (PurE)-related protein
MDRSVRPPRRQLEFDPLSRTAILGQPHRTLLTAPVAIVMAGTSDLPVGREAARTLGFAGQRYREYTDVGVAGLWRLLERIEDIQSSPVVIVAAGMDAALVSVVGGLVSSCDRTADLSRLWRSEGRRDSAARCVG